MSNKCFNAENPEVYIGKYEGEYKEEENNIDTLWEIEKETQGCQGQTCTMKENRESSAVYRLRHFRTGRFLSF